ncbi:putative phage-related endonuclease [Janthinobacterium sp. CG_23.3]|uniref:YqaJ viral recombinase family protein n=1 Tax=Janthinobacterium sp. CG_23.3 TaxID=3349634 RepID=UPI0038D42A24
MTKQIHNLVQGSADWQQYRLTMRGASEAAPMLGLSPNVSRTELLHMKATGTAKEFSDWVQENILDYGHEVEALARPLAEDLIGTELYPVTCSIGNLSASCDGLTMLEDIAFEHKQWNEALAASVAEDVLPDEHQPQCQQIMMITGAEKVLFVVSDGTSQRFVSMVVEPSTEWQERIRAGWAQFDKDMTTYEPMEYTAAPAADPIMALPALSIQIRGEVTVSNMPMFKAKADRFIASIKTELLTDDDFANAEEAIKFCDKTEKSLELAKAAAIAQTASIDELMRTVDHISAQLREKRLLLTRTVKDKKELLKAGILNKVKLDFAEHVAALELEIAPIRLVFQARDFAGAMKNKRTLATLQDAVDTELANGKISVDALAKSVRDRLTWYKEAVIDSDFAATNFSFLFADLQTLIQKPDDDFKLAVTARIDAHKASEAAKAKAALEAAEATARAKAELKAAQAAPGGADLSPAAQAINEQEGASLFAVHYPSVPSFGTAPTLRLGQIGARLGFNLTADFLRELGFEPAARDKSALLFHEGSFGYICQALVHHIQKAQAMQAA